jgi:microcystin-dependent protein
MVYTKTVWVASTAPGISESNLNNLETQYDCAVVIGEIKLYSGSTAPVNFFLCNGTSKAVASYAALFAVTSNKYGGDSTYFSLPNMMGVFPVGLSSNGGDYATIGSTGGSSGITLVSSQMPSHTHMIPTYVTGGAESGPSRLTASAVFHSNTVSGSAGEDAEHENRPPYVVLNYIIRYQ